VGKAYNLVDDGKISINEYLGRFKTVTGAKSKIIHLPYFMAWSLSLAYEGAAALKLVKPGATSRAQLKWKQKDLYYDGARSRQDFGYKTTVPVSEALDKTFRWWAGKFGV
jgi:nucleoside-diphosphate-sugar epimerase